MNKLVKWGIYVAAAIVAANAAMYLTEYRLLVGKHSTNGWVVEGDLLYPEWLPDLRRYNDKVAAKFTDCVYWNGLVVEHYAYPSEQWPNGCPAVLPSL
jgi:hypothetical protein